jgi:hypothetical protein
VLSEYSIVLAAVQEALGGVTSEAVRQRRARIQDAVSMPNDIALYVLAEQIGLPLHRMVKDPETLQRVAYFAKEIGGSGETPTTSGRGRTKHVAKKKETVVTIGGINVERLPGLTGPHAQDAKRMSEKAYPALYVFENSARDVIARVLEDAYGSNWWSKAVPKKVRERAEDVRKDEENEPGHGSRRGAREIDYVLLTDLAKIVRARWSHFEEIFPRPSWFEELVSGDMNIPRRVIAHMHPLGKDDVRGIETAFRK